jgi:nucleoside-diphosphate-sugar epimerase
MIFIFGGSGFIGTRVALRFNQSEIPFQIIDKAPSGFFPDKFLRADIRYPITISFPEKVNALINLAAEHKDNVFPTSLYDEVNVKGAKNVCELARAKNINTIIFTSSVAIYGFAPIGTNESGAISPFNDYGRTKWEAEQVYKKWQSEDPQGRTLVIIRPTVVFGERNRGNVFNFLRQIAISKFVMVGDGLNRKSMAYVENVAAFLQYSLNLKPGINIYNYVDKPDFTMNELVALVNKLLGRSTEIKLRLPSFVGLLIGSIFDMVAKITGKKFPISAIRVKKFCANSVYESAINETDFIPPVSLMEAIERTVHFEFIETNKDDRLFYSE